MIQQLNAEFGKLLAHIAGAGDILHGGIGIVEMIMSDHHIPAAGPLRLPEQLARMDFHRVDRAGKLKGALDQPLIFI